MSYRVPDHVDDVTMVTVDWYCIQSIHVDLRRVEQELEVTAN